MTTRPTIDHGQQLSSPAGKVIGFIDEKTQLDAFELGLHQVGIGVEGITSLYGEDGVHLLERLKDRRFFFGDSEDDIIRLATKELGLGHYAVSVEVGGHKQAEEVVELARAHHGHGFSYFGTWTTEQFRM
jgi:hypothetical protein